MLTESIGKACIFSCETKIQEHPNAKRVSSRAVTWVHFCNKTASHILMKRAIHLCHPKLIKSLSRKYLQYEKSSEITLVIRYKKEFLCSLYYTYTHKFIKCHKL
ncbi:hypothetical protein ACS0PU_006735 [Formica fusca]